MVLYIYAFAYDLGVKDVLFGHNVSETTPVLPGSMHILF